MTTARPVRRTKIIATIGPASSSPERIRLLLEMGVNVFRLNFSHGTREEHAERIRVIRKAMEAEHRPVGILQDLQGPKIRVGTFREAGGAVLRAGKRFRLRASADPGDTQGVALTNPKLLRHLRPGHRILLNDGLISLRVVAIDPSGADTEIVEGGPLTDHKGVNLPDTPIDLPSLSDKDLEDLRHGASLEVDWVALSFVRSREDLKAARGELHRTGSRAKLMAKIELRTAVDRIDEILGEADGIMIARGDLGVEMGPERVPVIQKQIIRACLDAGKPVVTATQMLESMIRNPTPTRAEASDVANAIFDGTDAVMLSAETATGEHPAEAVRMMDRIIREVEASPLYHDPTRNRRLADAFNRAEPNVQDAICLSATRNADLLGAKVIASFTASGSTAWRVARHRPISPTVALTPYEHVARQLSIGWGILALLAPDPSSSDHLTEEAIARLRAARLVQAGDTIVVTAGVPFGRTGATNMLRVERVPDSV